ncbi:MAG: class I SAM-dependent methyltransferase [Dehalococcoidia bacterium]
MSRLSIPAFLRFALRSNLYASKIRLDASARALIPRLSGRVLDVGAGAQPYRKYIRQECEYISMELADGQDTDMVGSVLDIPVSNDTFGGVICTEVIEHVMDPASAIREIYRVSKPGSFLYLTAPMSWGLHYEPNDYYRFTKYGLIAILEKGGYRVLETRQIGGVFTMTAARLSDTLVSLLYRIGFPLRYVVGKRWRISILSLIAFPFVALVDALATIADMVVPGSHKDALGWAILAEKMDRAAIE